MDRLRGALALGGVLAAAAAVIRYGTVIIDVRGASMRPTYEPGDRVLALRPWLDRPIRVGDVVIVRAPAATWSADDPLEAATIVLIKRVAEAPASSPPSPAHSIDAATMTGADRLYVLGDAAGHDAHDSYDSRAFGPLPRSAVLGRVVHRLSEAARMPVPAGLFAADSGPDSPAVPHERD